MALTLRRPTLRETALAESTTSIATTPIACLMVIPRAGILERVHAASGGVTTGTITVAVALNGGADLASGGLTIAAGAGFNANAGVFEFGMVGTTPQFVQEGDVLTLTPSGGTGTSIPGAFTAVIR